MARPYWDQCLVHLGNQASELLKSHFSPDDRHCLLFAGAGFDPRATHFAKALSEVMKARVNAILIREERGDAATNLNIAGDRNEAVLRGLIPNAQVERINIFSEIDQAAVGGHRIVELLTKYNWPETLTDIVVDFSALSIGISFPAAKFLIEKFAGSNMNIHFVIASDPDLESGIVGEPSSGALWVRGYNGSSSTAADHPPALIWLPHLAKDSALELNIIRSGLEEVYKICPILPFPARKPRRPDDLIEEYSGALFAEWEVAPRDFLYVSEWNPVDSYRALSTIKKRYDKTVESVYTPQIILSPIGSRVMAIGAMMAAIEHNLAIKYVEALRYDIKIPGALDAAPTNIQLVHIWADGPIYSGLKGRK